MSAAGPSDGGSGAAPPESERDRARASAEARIEALARECDLEFFMGGGPGGQHRNATASAVRLKHRPSGIVVVATTRRSQHQNRAEALDRLAQKLAARAVRVKPRRKTKPSRASKARRVDAKKRRGATKAGRGGSGRGEE